MIRKKTFLLSLIKRLKIGLIEQTISSIMNSELKDDDGNSYNTTSLMEGTKGQLDGEVETSGTLRGEISFDASTFDTYELHFSDPFKSGKTIWTITELE